MFCHSFVTLFLLDKKRRAYYNILDNLTTGGVSAEVMKDPEAPPLPLGKTARGSRYKMPHQIAVWCNRNTRGFDPRVNRASRLIAATRLTRARLSAQPQRSKTGRTVRLTRARKSHVNPRAIKCGFHVYRRAKKHGGMAV